HRIGRPTPAGSPDGATVSNSPASPSPVMKSTPSTSVPATSLARAVASDSSAPVWSAAMSTAPGSGTTTYSPRSGRPTTYSSPSRPTTSRAIAPCRGDAVVSTGMLTPKFETAVCRCEPARGRLAVAARWEPVAPGGRAGQAGVLDPPDLQLHGCHLLSASVVSRAERGSPGATAQTVQSGSRDQVVWCIAQPAAKSINNGRPA